MITMLEARPEEYPLLQDWQEEYTVAYNLLSGIVLGHLGTSATMLARSDFWIVNTVYGLYIIRL